MLRPSPAPALSLSARRYFSGLVPVVEKKAGADLAIPSNHTLPPPPAAPVVDKKPTKLQTHVNLMRTRVVWFCVGGFSIGLFGYWRLGEEIHQANTDLKTRLAGAHSDVQILQAHINDVEARLAKLEHFSTFNPPSDIV